MIHASSFERIADHHRDSCYTVFRLPVDKVENAREILVSLAIEGSEVSASSCRLDSVTAVNWRSSQATSVWLARPSIDRDLLHVSLGL
jgi:hypothetical protein